MTTAMAVTAITDRAAAPRATRLLIPLMLIQGSSVAAVSGSAPGIDTTADQENRGLNEARSRRLV
jgi:hypothetical protein